MKVHVVGSGGRESTLKAVLARTATIIDNEDEADLIVVGPETPLVNGYADQWRAKGKLVYGPGADGARLEGSKQFMKDFLARAGVPTARYGSFDNEADAVGFLSTLEVPYVIKTDGLAAGKGVFIAESKDEAVADIRNKLSGNAFGVAGTRVVIEECMQGPEVSLLYIFDGKKGGVALAPAQDFKRIGDGDAGPNTGGMGCYSGVPVYTDAIADTVMDRIIEPTCGTLRREGIDYRGTLYAGLMLTPDGPKIIEYNVRFGDPETQVVVPRFDGDLAATLASAASGHLHLEGNVAIAEQAVTVVMASAGYPETSRSGDVITGIDEAEAVPGVSVFPAGMKYEDGRPVTAGGRVLNVTALAPTLAEARKRAYEAVDRIHFDGMQFRRDIALIASQA